jgi:hypothetical protein
VGHRGHEGEQIVGVGAKVAGRKAIETIKVQRSAASQYTREFTYRSACIAHVFDHVDEGHHVEAPNVEGEHLGFGMRKRYVGLEAGGAHASTGEQRVIDVNAGDVCTTLLECSGECAELAFDVEYTCGVERHEAFDVACEISVACNLSEFEAQPTHTLWVTCVERGLAATGENVSDLLTRSDRTPQKFR